jgi:hypothetical protein
VAITSTHSRWSTWWPFALLCLFAALRGLLTDAFPTSATTLLSVSTGCAAAALITLLLSVRILPQLNNMGAPCPASGTWAGRISMEPRVLLAGALLLSGPLAPLILTGHGIDPTALTLALAIVPIVAAVAQNALDDAPTSSFAARTWPALAAIAGLLLIIPQPSFANPITDAVLIAAPLATGIGAALFVTSPQNQSTFTSALSAAALLFALAWLVQFLLHHSTAHFSPLAALLDAIAAFLALLALNRIGLARWSAQFALVPLAVVLQGFILLYPALNIYYSAGTSLLLLGSIFLLLPQPAEKASLSPVPRV